MKALFIGGTGVISAACSQRAVELGFELTVLNRAREIVAWHDADPARRIVDPQLDALDRLVEGVR